MARLLAAFIAAGLVYLVLPGTVIGAWNLIRISSHRSAGSVSSAWIQAHGHAQLFGWVGTFIIGISLYTFPKFRGSALRSIPIGWFMLAAWVLAIGLRWYAGVAGWNGAVLLPATAWTELGVAALLLWQCSPAGPSHRRNEPLEMWIFAGFGGLLGAMLWQVYAAALAGGSDMLPAGPDHVLISLALWAFCLPVVFGYSARFLRVFLNLGATDRRGVLLSLGFTSLAAVSCALDWQAVANAGNLCAVICGVQALRIFEPSQRPPKTAGVDPAYPLFARVSFAWLVVSAVLGLAFPLPGVLGASRHAFTVGCLATLIFAIGPRILPTFLNSRELWSIPLMRASMVSLTAGCFLRVLAEPLAYNDWLPLAWQLLPVSAIVETAAVLLFALNMAMTLASKVPSWFQPDQVTERTTVYWLVESYPATRRVLIDAGVTTLSRVRRVPQTLTLGEAALADGASPDALVQRLREFFATRLAATAKRQMNRR